MTRLKPAVIPLYIFLCLLIGGSAQGRWGYALLQLLAIGILAWAALTREPTELTAAGKRLFLIAAAVLALFAIQLVPLPPAIWTQLPGRGFVAEGYGLLGLGLPWQPISLAPYDTLTTAMTLLPPIAVLAGMLRLGAFKEDWLVAALLAGACASVVTGTLQVTSGGTSWYFYRFSNFGAAAGFFANSNHMAALLLVGVPFLAATAASRWRRLRDIQARPLIVALALGAAAVLGVGILVNGSFAVLLLGAPVAAATAIMVLKPSPRRMRLGFLLAALLLVAGAIAIGFAGRAGAGAGNETSIETRAAIWSESVEAIGDHWLGGTGIGTFGQVYRRYENPATIDRFFVNHAHNDYLEIALETGLPGMLLLVGFFAWWAGRAVHAWRSSTATHYMKAASIASATLLLHSFVDFPLRTAALSSVMAMCLALMAEARGTRRPPKPDGSRPARHVTL